MVYFIIAYHTQIIYTNHTFKFKIREDFTFYMRLFIELPVLCYRLQIESESWEALLNKHQNKAEELER